MGAMNEVSVEVNELNVDYAIYCGTLHAEHNDVALKECHPRIYLETYMEMHTQPSYEACKYFLNQFLTYSEVEKWLETIAWDNPDDHELDEDELDIIVASLRFNIDVLKDGLDDMAKDAPERPGQVKSLGSARSALRKVDAVRVKKDLL